MGSFLSRGPAGEATEEEAQELKASGAKETKRSPTKRSVRDGRSYVEVVRAGSETDQMSALQQPGSAWKFCEAPQNGEVPLS